MLKFNPDTQLNIHELTVEEPEKPEGRDPKVFLDEAFDWIEKNLIGLYDISRWSYSISSDNKFISMNLPSSVDLPENFYDTIKKMVFEWDVNKNGTGIDTLKRLLAGKKIISIKDRNNEGNWYLEIADKVKKELKSETPQIPEQKQF